MDPQKQEKTVDDLDTSPLLTTDYLGIRDLPPANEQVSRGVRIVAKDNIAKLILLFIFTVLYGYFAPQPRSAVDGFLHNVLFLLHPGILFSPVVITLFIDIIYKTIILTTIFIIVGYLSKTRWLAIVPVVAYEIINRLGILHFLLTPLGGDFFKYLNLRFLVQEGPYDYESSTVFLRSFAYALAFILVLGVYYLTFIRTNRWRTRLAAAVIMLAIIPICLFATLNKIGTQMLLAEQRKQDTILVAQTADIFSDGEWIMYPPMQHLGGKYVNHDEMSYKKIFPSNKRSTQASCGYNVQTTKIGNSYTASVKQETKGSQTNKGFIATGTYTTYHYCFVIGSYKYDLTRDTEYDGPAYIDKYPAQAVIDSIYAGKQVVHACSYAPFPGLSETNIKMIKYCDENAIKQADNMLSTFKAKLSTYCAGGRYNYAYQCSDSSSDDKVPKETSHYTEVGRLNIPEMGISLPLAEGFTDVYYAKEADTYGTSTQPASYIGLRIGLQRYDKTTPCFANNRTIAGRQVNGRHVGFLSRMSKSDDKLRVKNQGYSPFGGVDLGGDYLYRLVATESNIADCGIQDPLDDLFIWMQANIRIL